MGKVIPSVLLVVVILLLLIPDATGQAEIQETYENRIVIVYVTVEKEVVEPEAKIEEDVKKEVTIESSDKKEIEPVYETFELTAYTAGAESTGKSPSHPEYGITASGKKVKEMHTIACPPSMEFGTKVYIPYFDNIFTCLDRGSAITEGHIDVYIKDLNEALKFGRQQLDVQILEKGGAE